MSTEMDFRNKLNFIIQRIPDHYRGELTTKIELMIAAGVSTYDDLLTGINNPSFSESVRTIASWLAARIGDPRAKDALLLAARDQSAEIRRYAVQALGELNIQSAQITQVLSDTVANDLDVEVRKIAAYALGNLGDSADSDVIGLLINILINQGEAPAVRGMAAEALSSIRAISAIPSLVEMLKDESPEVKFWSAFALGCIGDTNVVKPLTELAEAQDFVLPKWGSVREEAQKAIDVILERGA